MWTLQPVIALHHQQLYECESTNCSENLIFTFFWFFPKNIQPVLSILSLPVQLDHHSLLSLKHQFFLKHRYT